MVPAIPLLIPRIPWGESQLASRGATTGNKVAASLRRRARGDQANFGADQENSMADASVMSVPVSVSRW